MNWLLVPEFASVALTDVRRTEGNPKLPTAKSVKDLLNQGSFYSEIDAALALINAKNVQIKTALKASAVRHTQL